MSSVFRNFLNPNYLKFSYILVYYSTLHHLHLYILIVLVDLVLMINPLMVLLQVLVDLLLVLVLLLVLAVQLGPDKLCLREELAVAHLLLLLIL